MNLLEVLHESATSFSYYKSKLHNFFEHNTDNLMSRPTVVLLLHALQQNVLQVFFILRREVWVTDYMSGSSTMVLCACNTHITVHNVTNGVGRTSWTPNTFDHMISFWPWGRRYIMYDCMRCSSILFWCKEGVVKRDVRKGTLNASLELVWE